MQENMGLRKILNNNAPQLYTKLILVSYCTFQAFSYMRQLFHHLASLLMWVKGEEHCNYVNHDPIE
jgi:hypothetical protein